MSRTQHPPPAVPTPADIRRLARINPRRAEQAIRRAHERLAATEIDALELAQATSKLDSLHDELRRLGELDAAQRGPGIHQPWGLATVQAITVAGPVCGQRRPSSRESHRTRPGHRRTSSSSTTSSSDPGDLDSEGPEADAARLRAFLVRLISFDWPEALIDRAYRFSVDIEREVTS